MSYTEFKAKWVIGRKDHNCEWCGERIPKGERQFYRVFIFDGDFNNGRTHPECKTAIDNAPNDQLNDGWLPGDYKRGSNDCY